MKDDKNKIKIIREEYFVMTQEQFCRLIGCCVATLSRWERGHFKPSVDYIKKIIKVSAKHGITLTYDDVI